MKIIPDDNARGKLFYAFLDLIKEKPYNKIKVSELIEKAGVNRSTFYRYYSDIYDYYDRICSRGLNFLTEGLEQAKQNISTEKDLILVRDIMISRLELLSDVIVLLTGKNGNISFVKNFKGYVNERLEDIFDTSERDEITLVSFYGTQICDKLFLIIAPQADISYAETADIGYDPAKGTLENVTEQISCNSNRVAKKIILSAVKIFMGQDPHSFSVNNITKHAGVSRTEFYNFFGSTAKMIKSALSEASCLCASILFTLTTCNESSFSDFLPRADLRDFIGNDDLLEIFNCHREFYLFVSYCTKILFDMLKKKLVKENVQPNKEQLTEIRAYTAWAIRNFVEYADNLTPEEFKSNILWAKKRLENSGICL